ncbi:MAG: DUF1851 domain-containing protein [Lachnospiraceae bacterium]|nr:DUF1851 domain-containing protein [Lachnospiraceae bacterium]
MLPDKLKEYLDRGNDKRLLNGYICLLDEEERVTYTGLLQPLVSSDGNMEAFAVSAFGDFFCWDGKYVYLVKLVDNSVNVILSGFDFFFQNIEDAEYQNDYFDLPLYDFARKIVGELAQGECYAFDLLPQLGGEKAVSNIRRERLTVYVPFVISMLSQVD